MPVTKCPSNLNRRPWTEREARLCSWFDRVEVVVGDALDPTTLAEAPGGSASRRVFRRLGRGCASFAKCAAIGHRARSLDQPCLTMGCATIHRLTTVYITISASIGYWLLTADFGSLNARRAITWER